MKYRTLIIHLLFIISCGLFAQEYTVEDVPNPKTSTTNNFVSNPDRIITTSSEATINYLADSLRRHNGVEIAVVLLNSVGYTPIKDFAVDLFNTWGIGKAGVDNGLLILFVNDQRSVTFETGYGIEGDLPDAICKRIQMEQMVPYFKAGDYDAGMVSGMRAIVDVLEKGTYNEEPVKQSFLDRNFGLIIFLLIGIIIFIIISYILISKSKKAREGDPYDAFFKIKTLSHWALGLAIISPFLVGIYTYLRILKNKMRKVSRPCKQCGTMIEQRLDEKTDDDYLSANNAFEEAIGSVDYDVWLCSSCSEVEILTFPQKSKYTRCSSCKTVAQYQTSDTIITRATTHSTGSGVRTYECKYCKRTHKKKYTIPKVVESSSRSGGSSGSSSSSGGSWGGGSSGGGGATSSW